jgi:hypothetical protein
MLLLKVTVTFTEPDLGVADRKMAWAIGVPVFEIIDVADSPPMETDDTDRFAELFRPPVQTTTYPDAPTSNEPKLTVVRLLSAELPPMYAISIGGLPPPLILNPLNMAVSSS